MTHDRLPPAAVSAREWGWRHASRKAWAVEGLDLEIEPGERVLLLGASGAGKSTLMHALAGVIGGDDEGEQRGELRVAGQHATRARGIAGLVLQDPDSQVILARVGDDVAFGCENLGVPRDEIWRRVVQSLDEVGLDLPLDHPTSALSGGQKQRLALAGVLAMRPGLILLDEPTANLDPAGVAEVRDAVSRVARSTGATLVVIEHRVEVWRDIVDRVVVLAPGGGVLADGAPHAVLSAQGAELSASGVWIPEFPPRFAERRSPSSGGRLLDATGLAIARVRGSRIAAGLDVSLDEGRAVAIVGPNGAGKSTLALTLAGLLRPEEGVVSATPLLAGALTSTSPISWRSKDLLTRIGTVFQDPEHQFLATTVRDELAVGPRALELGDHTVEQRVDELLHRLRLDHLALANPFTLSGGEKRRLSVATVLATKPKLLVLDEPTFGQDSRTWSELVSLLAELLDEGQSILAVTHDADFVRALADDEVRLS